MARQHDGSPISSKLICYFTSFPTGRITILESSFRIWIQPADSRIVGI